MPCLAHAEKYVRIRFTDLSEQMTFEVKGSKIFGPLLFAKDYDLQGGKAAGQYSNGKPRCPSRPPSARGETLLMGFISQAAGLLPSSRRRNQENCFREFF